MKEIVFGGRGGGKLQASILRIVVAVKRGEIEEPVKICLLGKKQHRMKKYLEKEYKRYGIKCVVDIIPREKIRGHKVDSITFDEYNREGKIDGSM